MQRQALHCTVSKQASASKQQQHAPHSQCPSQCRGFTKVAPLVPQAMQHTRLASPTDGRSQPLARSGGRDALGLLCMLGVGVTSPVLLVEELRRSPYTLRCMRWKLNELGGEKPQSLRSKLTKT